MSNIKDYEILFPINKYIHTHPSVASSVNMVDKAQAEIRFQILILSFHSIPSPSRGHLHLGTQPHTLTHIFSSDLTVILKSQFNPLDQCSSFQFPSKKLINKTTLMLTLEDLFYTKSCPAKSTFITMS